MRPLEKTYIKKGEMMTYVIVEQDGFYDGVGKRFVLLKEGQKLIKVKELDGDRILCRTLPESEETAPHQKVWRNYDRLVKVPVN